MIYRREIDGLRAMAVLPVILFHAGFNWFGGGFVGVDVFFVISGYLITSIILAEKEAGKFSLASFYERRARRILPALFFVMLVCLPFAFSWMLPHEMRNFSQSIIAVSTFLSNVFFWLSTGYFETDAELKPLLHTWSLSVEEQYYVFFPLLLILFWNFGKRWVLGVLIFMAVTSLLAAEFSSARAGMASAAFFLLPTRGWELLIGAFIAFYHSYKNRAAAPTWIAETLALIGLALVTYSVVAFSKSTPYPSIYTLIPTLGTACIILFATQQTIVGKILGNKLLVGVGLISYSAYLWHQPLFAFARMLSLGEPGNILMLALAVASLLLAYGTWRYVELPFREKSRFSRRSIFLMAGTMSAALVALGLGVDSAMQTGADKKSDLIKAQACEGFRNKGTTHCKRYGHGEKRIVVWGDSHADMLSKYDLASINKNYSFYVISHFGCPPLINTFRHDGLGVTELNCNTLTTLTAHANYIKSLSPEIVILAGRWEVYINGWRKQGELRPQTHFISNAENNMPNDAAASRDTFRQQLGETIDFFKPQKVILIQQIPDLERYGDIPQIARNNISISSKDVNSYHQSADAILNAAEKSHDNVQIFFARDIFCGSDSCRVTEGEDFLYIDDNHLSALGVQYLGEGLSRYLSEHVQIFAKVDRHQGDFTQSKAD